MSSVVLTTTHGNAIEVMLGLSLLCGYLRGRSRTFRLRPRSMIALAGRRAADQEDERTIRSPFLLRSEAMDSLVEKVSTAYYDTFQIRPGSYIADIGDGIGTIGFERSDVVKSPVESFS